MKFELEEVKAFIRSTSQQTRIYIGCDSERIKSRGKHYATYSTVVVVHIDGSRGCKVFGRIDKEPDYDERKDKPILRLMNEVYRVAALYQELQDVIGKRTVELHLDINPSKKYGSNCACKDAINYIKGNCHMAPKIKPDAFAASTAADRHVRSV